jgi:predicted Zn-dependent peptidase
MFKKSITLLLMLYIFLGVQPTNCQTLQSIKAEVQEFTLDNGLHFIVLERHDAPVVSFHTYADVGAANETYGITGISHLLEHMAFKGTKTVGTTDYDKERVILNELDRLYNQMWQLKMAPEPDSMKLQALEEKFEEKRLAAKELVVNNEFIDLMRREGDAGVNAYTSNDATQYIHSFPSNRLEFWMAAESDRFLNPVFREFYKEKDVVMEERRLRTDNTPIGKLLEEFFAVAFKAHPYKHPVVGHMSDLQRIQRSDVEDYFETYYIPSNMVIGIVGDVETQEVRKLAKVYWGRIPGGAKPEPVRTTEPTQQGEKHFYVEAQSQPLVIAGYHRPAADHPDDAPLEALANILGQGRSSRIYTTLVKEEKIAAQTGSFNGFPGSKYANLFAVFAMPSKDHSNEECLETIDKEIEKMQTEKVTDLELQKFKRSYRKNLFDAMKSNANMARLLTNSKVLYGDWRDLFDEIDQINAVTAEDIQRVAREYLIKKNRTVGELIPEKSI